MKNFLVLFLCSFVIFSCDDDDNGSTDNAVTVPEVSGMTVLVSENSFDDTYQSVITALQNNSNIGIVAEVDHQSNAQSVNLDLNPTKIVFFGNPALGTPLMIESQSTGLDLPQRLLVYQDDDENVFVAYNDPKFLEARHDLDNQSMTLDQISGALSMIAGDAAGTSTNSGSSSDDITTGQGIVTTDSPNTFDQTLDQLRSAIQSNPNLILVSELDHQANAQSVGMTLPPTTVLIFGNPNLGTPLIQDEQTIALDLPQKMLVYETSNGQVKVAYNNPQFLATRHSLDNSDSELQTITMALSNLTDAAIQ